MKEVTKTIIKISMYFILSFINIINLMIIIEFSGETFTLKERFSVALLKLIAGWIPDADFLTFESSEKVIEQIISNDHKVILSTYQ